MNRAGRFVFARRATELRVASASLPVYRTDEHTTRALVDRRSTTQRVDTKTANSAMYDVCPTVSASALVENCVHTFSYLQAILSVSHVSHAIDLLSVR